MIEKWMDEVRTATSIASFESTSRTNFVQQLERCITAILSQNESIIRTGGSSSGSDESSLTIHRYNPRLIETSLIRGIEWKSLFLYHDRYVASSLTVKNASSSALQVIINSLLDPRVVPFALSASILRILVWALVSHSSGATQSSERKQQGVEGKDGKTSTPVIIVRSRTLVLQSIKRIMQRSQSREELGAIVLSVIKENPSLPAFQSALAIVQYFMKELKDSTHGVCPKRALFPCLLGLLAEVMKRKEMLSPKGKETDETSICVSCMRCIGTPPLNKRRKRPTQADLAALHDEWEGCDQVNFTTSEQSSYPSRNYQRNQTISLKSIVQENSPGLRCPHCKYPLSTTKSFHDSIPMATVRAWCHFRDKFIHNIVSIFQSAVLVSREKALNIFQAMIRYASNDNPHVRLLMLQLAETGGYEFYVLFINRLWKLGLEWDQRYLTWYTEVLVVSSFCDDRLRCWDALQPLVNATRSRRGEEASKKGERESLLKTMLPCLGYILSKRSNLLQSECDLIYKEFSSLLTELSLSYSELQWWVIRSDNSHYTGNEEVVGMLQSLGIVSASSILLEEENPVHDDRHNPSEAMVCWHPPEAEEIRSAYQQLTWSPHGSGKIHSLRYEMSWSLLSDPNADPQQLPSKPSLPQGVKVKECTKQSAPIMYYLSNDNIRSVFEFLGYKKLVRIRCVCKNWKELADEDRLWCKHYEKRYGMLHDEFVTKQGSWKDSFISKWSAFRGVRFKYNQKGDFKYGICPYIGCCRILSNPKVVESHKAFHEKRIIKMREKEERERKRKIRRQEKEEQARRRKRKKVEYNQKIKIGQLPR